MRPLACILPALLAACSGNGEAVATGNSAAAAAAPASGRPFQVQELARFNEPWAMTFLPGGQQALITEKSGRLLLWTREGPAAAAVAVAGTPNVDYGGQGGLGDVVLHPRFAQNRLVYLSWVEAGPADTRGAVVGRARLSVPGTGC